MPLATDTPYTSPPRIELRLVFTREINLSTAAALVEGAVEAPAQGESMALHLELPSLSFEVASALAAYGGCLALNLLRQPSDIRTIDALALFAGKHLRVTVRELISPSWGRELAARLTKLGREGRAMIWRNHYRPGHTLNLASSRPKPSRRDGLRAAGGFEAGGA